MSSFDSTKTQHQVICVCGGFGFPQGDASTARITIVGRALQAAGIKFGLLHCGPSPIAVNTRRSGVHEGISFEYTTLLRRPANKLARMLVYMWGIWGLTVRLSQLWPARRRTAVYLYVMEGLLNPYVGCLCWILGLPVVQELCEWSPGDSLSIEGRRWKVASCSAFTRWLHRKPMFKLATGVLAISSAIEKRVRERAVEVNPHLRIHRLPNVVDAKRFALASPTMSSLDPLVPNFVYCGTWMLDVVFIIRAFALTKLSGYRSKLTMVGRYTEAQNAMIREYATDRGLSPGELVLTGYVDERTLESSYKTSAALLMPLRQDDRSFTRLPNKMGEYLASGRPVISCKIGDLTDFLIDDVNAYLGEPGDERDFADKMIAVLRDPDRAKQIGVAGQRAGMAQLDYRGHVDKLGRFFVDCIVHGQKRRFTQKRTGRMSRGFVALRNSFCGSLALCVIASGGVRRAKRRALSGDVVTAIYFHKPNRRLFARCIRWLIKNGYQFISENDLVDILYRRQKPPKGAVWLSFDDGCKELLDVLPLIRIQQIPITLFIPTGIVQGSGLFPWLHRPSPGGLPSGHASASSDPRDSLAVDEVIRVARYPEVTIGSHTMSHALTTGLTEEEAGVELGESKRTLESWTGAEVKCLAYPEGQFDGGERLFLERFGYAMAATTENALVTPETDPYRVPRLTVADDIYFPEAICNLVGVWRPAIDPFIHVLQRNRRIAAVLREALKIQSIRKGRLSA
jgi:poly-beta-1,6-N-acetyl-D-glucosamine N-deacetylase